MTFLRSVRIMCGLAIAAWLLALPHAPTVFAEPTSFNINIPKAIGALQLDKVEQASEQSRATRLAYKAPGMTLTVYVFGSNPEPPDGIDSSRLIQEFEQAKSAIRDPRAWKQAKQVHEGTAELGAQPHICLAREAVFKVKSEEDSATSYLYLTAAHGIFFKARYSAWRKQRNIGEAQIPEILRAVGDLIVKVVEKKEGATYCNRGVRSIVVIVEAE